MSDIERLAHASTELANHVAAVVRMSNELVGLLRDAVRDDVDAVTKFAVLARIKAMHDAFRAEHFHGTIASVNVVMEVSDRLYQVEPASSEAPLPPAIPVEDAPVVQLADVQEEPDAAPAP